MKSKLKHFEIITNQKTTTVKAETLYQAISNYVLSFKEKIIFTYDMEFKKVTDKFKPLLLILFLASCSTEQQLPECTSLVSVKNGKAFLKIDSQSESVEMCTSLGNCMTIIRHYFNCISLAVEPGEVITITDETKVCQIVIP